VNSESSAAHDAQIPPNGSGAAAILSAAIGSFALAILAIAADKIHLLKSLLAFYKPTGPPSGVTTVAVFIWTAAWGILESRWRKQAVNLNRIGAAAVILLGLSLLLTFPPVVDLF
jgi:hypothetical protein